METEEFNIVLLLISMMSFFINSPYPAFYTIAILLILYGITNASCNAIIPIFALWSTSSQGYDGTIEVFSVEFILLAVIFIIGFGFLVYRIVKNKSISSILEKLNKNLILYGIIAIIISMFISLINTPRMDFSFVGIGNYSIMCAIFLVATLKVNEGEEAKNIMLHSIIYLGIMITIEAIYKFGILMHGGLSAQEIINGKLLDLGWCVSNHWAVLVIIAIFVSFYLFMMHEKGFWKNFSFATGIIFTGLLLITGCRGGYIGLLASIPGFIALYIYHLKKENISFKRDMWYFIGIFGLIVIGILALAISGYLSKIFEELTDTNGSIENGREVVWKIAWKEFTNHWFIGAGVNTGRYFINKETGGWWHYWYYHNHYLQIMAGCGIVGAICFTFYIVAQVLRCIRKDEFSLFGLIVILYFLVHGALDTLYFNASIEPVLLIILAYIGLNKESYCLTE